MSDIAKRLRRQLTYFGDEYERCRNDALEEAAKAIEEWCADEDDLKLELGNVIRALKEKTGD